MSENTPIRVLLVDDEYPVRVSLGGYLQDRDFDVFSAESAEEMLNLLQHQKIDWVIVDIRLPGIDGNQLIVKAHEVQPDLKFLIHTGSTTYQIPPEVTAIGITDEMLFRKPLPDMSVLVKAMRRCGGKHTSKKPKP